MLGILTVEKYLKILGKQFYTLPSEHCRPDCSNCSEQCFELAQEIPSR